MCTVHILSPDGEASRLTNLVGALALALSDRLQAQTNSDSAALITLLDRGALTVDFLRRVVGLSHSATVRLVDRLSARRFVERGPGRDGRSIAVRLTPRGRRVATRLRQEREHALATSLATLDAGERAHLGSLIEKVLAGLTTDRWQARHICRLCDHGLCQDARGCPVDQAATGA